MEFLKVKKRYNKFISWLLVEFSSLLIQGVAGWIMVVVMATKNTQAIDLTSSKETMLTMVIVPIIGLIGMVLTTLYINKRTPKGGKDSNMAACFLDGMESCF